MEDLQLIGVQEDGEHLLLAGPRGTRYRLPMDEPLRAAVRRGGSRQGLLQIDVDGVVRPREVQAWIRAGATAEEVAERAGWSVEKVRKYEGPILAEREHVEGLARASRLRGRGGSPTLAHRVGERLSGRGVDPSTATWDSWRTEDGPWTVVVTFSAGGRRRQAAWRFDLVDRTLTAADDEARWLSEDEQPTSALLHGQPESHAAAHGSAAADDAAAGPADGADATTGDRPGVGAAGAAGAEAGTADPSAGAAGVLERPAEQTSAGAGHAADAGPAADQPTPAGGRSGDPVDLMTAMRLRSTARERGRSGSGRRAPRPADRPDSRGSGPGQLAPHEPALPLEDLTEQAARDEAAAVARAAAAAEAEAAAAEAEAAAGSEAAEEHRSPASAVPPGAAGAGPAEAAARHTEGDVDSGSRPARRSRRGRPSVPAWDDIMFGSRSDEDG